MLMVLHLEAVQGLVLVSEYLSCPSVGWIEPAQAIACEWMTFAQ